MEAIETYIRALGILKAAQGYVEDKRVDDMCKTLREVLDEMIDVEIHEISENI